MLYGVLPPAHPVDHLAWLLRRRDPSTILTFHNADELLPFVSTACIDKFIEPITHMINESLKSGVFPSELKLARVVPFLSLVIPAYSLTIGPYLRCPFFSKKNKKFVYILVFDFLSDNEIMYDYQFGFRSNHST